MSPSTPRSAALHEEVYAWLSDDDEITDRLGDDGGIVPIALAKESDANPRIAVATSASSTDRENNHEAGTYAVRVIVDATDAWTKTHGTHELTKLKDRVADLVTENHGDWRATGLTTDDEVRWTESVNRHLGGLEAEFERRNARAGQ